MKIKMRVTTVPLLVFIVYTTHKQYTMEITSQTGRSNLASKFGQIGPKWDKSGTFFKISFSTFWLVQCDPIWMQNLTSPPCTLTERAAGVVIQPLA